MPRRFPALLIVCAVFVTDRLFKNFILNHYAEGDGFSVWPGVFQLTRVNNTGAAFGLLRGAALGLGIFAVVFAACVLIHLLKGGASAGWALVAGGALGNSVDRIRYGYVIDFLDFRVWPVFNVADACICVGVFFVLLQSFKRKAK